jgi:hypothetical protein
MITYKADVIPTFHHVHSISLVFIVLPDIGWYQFRPDASFDPVRPCSVPNVVETEAVNTINAGAGLSWENGSSMLPHATACYRMLPHATAKSKSSPLHIHQKSSKWLEHILKWIKAKASDLAHLNILYCFQATHFFSCEMIPKWVSFVFFILKFVASHLLMSFQNPKLPNIEIFGMFRISWIP